MMVKYEVNRLNIDGDIDMQSVDKQTNQQTNKRTRPIYFRKR